MIRVGTISFLVLLICGAVCTAPAAAQEEPGLEDLDKATSLQITAESPEDIDKIIPLAESALEKGLSKANEQYAKQLLTSLLYRRAMLRSAALLGQEMDRGQARQLWEQAIKDLEKAISHNQEFADAYLLMAQLQSISGADREKAMQALSKAIELLKDDKQQLAEAILLRAQLREEPADMLEDVNKVLEMFPSNTDALLLRSQIYKAQGESEKARADLDQALEQQPQLLEAVMLRIMFAEDEGRYGDAIEDIKRLLRLDPDNIQLQLQLALYYSALEQPRAAIDAVNQVLEQDPGNWVALRVRADSRLSIGKHEEAIEDYEKALAQQPENARERSGILNNLAWTLATSPFDKLRDGQRALELAKEAAELTDHQEAHILSTLGAAYAETGDFEKAKEWSAKAVELSEGDLKKELEKELRSYEQNKPWRELKEDPMKSTEQPQEKEDSQR